MHPTIDQDNNIIYPSTKLTNEISVPITITVSQAGQPLAGVEVYIQESGSPIYPGELLGTTGTDGVVQGRHLIPDIPTSFAFVFGARAWDCQQFKKWKKERTY